MEKSFYLEKFSIDEFINCLKATEETHRYHEMVIYVSDVNNYILNKIKSFLIDFHQILKYPIQAYLEFGLLVLRVQIKEDIPIAKKEFIYKILSQKFQEESFLEYAKNKIKYFIEVSNDEDIVEELNNIMQDINVNTNKEYIERRVRLAEEIVYD